MLPFTGARRSSIHAALFGASTTCVDDLHWFVGHFDRHEALHFEIGGIYRHLVWIAAELRHRHQKGSLVSWFVDAEQGWFGIVDAGDELDCREPIIEVFRIELKNNR